MTKKQKKVLIRIIISAVLLVAFKLICYLAPVNKYVELVLFLIPYLVIGYDILKKAVTEYSMVKYLMRIFLWQ